MKLDSEFVKLLGCPDCDSRPPLRLEDDTLVCDQCGRVYPIEDGIPNLLPKEVAATEK